LIIFGYLSFTTVRGQKIGFNSCECIKFLNIANFHPIHVSGKRILSGNDTTFFLHFFLFCNATFFYSGYVIKPPQPSSAIYGAHPFTGHPILICTLMPEMFKSNDSVQLAYICARAGLHAMPTAIVRKLTMTEPQR